MVDCSLELAGNIVVQIYEIFINVATKMLLWIIVVGLLLGDDVIVVCSSGVFSYGGGYQLQSAIDPIVTRVESWPHGDRSLELSLLACLMMVSCCLLLLEVIRLLLVLLRNHILLVQWMDH